MSWKEYQLITSMKPSLGINRGKTELVSNISKTVFEHTNSSSHRWSLEKTSLCAGTVNKSYIINNFIKWTSKCYSLNHLNRECRMAGCKKEYTSHLLIQLAKLSLNHNVAVKVRILALCDLISLIYFTQIALPCFPSK